MRTILIIAAAIAAIARPAYAQERTYSGNDLIEACRVVAKGTITDTHDPLHVGVCLGEIEALNWTAPGVHDENFRSCPPDEVTRQQLAKVVVDYLDRNHDQLTEPFEGLALEAFAHTWPCSAE